MPNYTIDYGQRIFTNEELQAIKDLNPKMVRCGRLVGMSEEDALAFVLKHDIKIQKQVMIKYNIEYESDRVKRFDLPQYIIEETEYKVTNFKSIASNIVRFTIECDEDFITILTLKYAGICIKKQNA